MSEQTYVPVTVSVPSERVPAFYEMFGQWLGATEDPPEAHSEWLTANDADFPVAARVWDKMSETAQGLFETLWSTYAEDRKNGGPGWKVSDCKVTKFEASTLAEMHGMNVSQLAGTLAWPGRYAYEEGRVLPVKWAKSDEGTTVYWMDPAVALLFRAVAVG